MAMNISCKFEKASYNIFFVRAVTVKSPYTLQRRRHRRNEVKSIVSTGCYPVDTTNTLEKCNDFNAYVKYKTKNEINFNSYVKYKTKNKIFNFLHCLASEVPHLSFMTI